MVGISFGSGTALPGYGRRALTPAGFTLLRAPAPDEIMRPLREVRPAACVHGEYIDGANEPSPGAPNELQDSSKSSRKTKKTKRRNSGVKVNVPLLSG